MPGSRFGRVSLELWGLWWLMLNSPGPFAWKQLYLCFPTTLLSLQHAKGQQRSFSVVQLSNVSILDAMTLTNTVKKL